MVVIERQDMIEKKEMEEKEDKLASEELEKEQYENQLRMLLKKYRLNKNFNNLT